MEEHQRGFGEYELVPWSKKERGSGTAGKVLVKVVPNCSREEWKAYDILNGYTHYRVYNSNNEFARGKSAKQRMSKFNGLMRIFSHI